MYIIKRTSSSGGTEYMIEAHFSRYRWDKKTKRMAHKFASRSHANRLARIADARVERLVTRRSR